MSAIINTDDLRRQEYQLRQEVNRLRREVYERPGEGASTEQLRKAEMELHQAEKKRAAAQSAEKSGSREGLIVDTRKTTGLAGPLTTGLEAEVNLKMAQVPTSICHLFDPAENPLVTCSIKNMSDDPEQKIRRVRVTSYIEGYSAKAVDTAEIEKNRPAWEFNQMPTLFPERAKRVTELTRATLNVLIEDLDGRVELQKTKPIWLLARTTAPLTVQDPTTGKWKDMTRYFGAFVTPNAPSVMAFLKSAAQNQAGTKLVGYQGKKEAGVSPQVEALFNALREVTKLDYVNSTIAFSPEEGSSNQRVRLPRESLKDEQANCIDGTVLFASLLEAISLNPAIVIVPGHAFVGWETWDKSDEWKFLETTMIRSHTFQQSCDWAQDWVDFYQDLKAEIQNENNGAESKEKSEEKFRLWPVRELRAVHRIMPME